MVPNFWESQATKFNAEWLIRHALGSNFNWK